ncbi:lipoprotein insertase outer membrane protein LolB [Alteromonas sp. W364]|uniref:lipoprotein insertase outer membrane protein LolB n=1 Tax=Alteromonas sp. W364 TaxID=3075610 RepID=UPI0028857E68|nr:lipoprotein insertase outer membrane protein LolB [Alteromonas sp. W364]MDT0628464.1 lipoprotein insertase outer membrane protein LolB [Alteromonas sp. W364]
MLAACKTAPQQAQKSVFPDNYDSLSNQEKLRWLSHWELSGKIAVITPDERKSAYLNWEQREREFDFKLSNLIGVTLLDLNYDGIIASIEADGETYTDSSTEALIYRTTGWILPLENLPQWIKGQTNEEDLVELNADNLPKRLTPVCAACFGWEITYSDYKETDGVWLPYAITVRNPQKKTQLKFKVNQWTRQ